MDKIKFLDLKLDFMFKQLFGHPSRKEITIAFLNDLLGRHEINRFIDLTFKNTDLVKETSDGKSSRVDILVTTSIGEQINIEIQLANPYNMPERILYYWGRIYTASLHEGKTYVELPTTIVISILNFSLFKQETNLFQSKFQVLETTKLFPFSDKLELHILDLKQFMVQWKKYRRRWNKDKKAVPWLLLLTAADNEKDTVDSEIIRELEEWAMNYEEVKTALREWEKLSVSKENRAEYEWRLKELRDHLNGLKGARNEGFKLGIEKGIHKVAQKMITQGMGEKEISDLTDLSIDEIKELKKRN